MLTSFLLLWPLACVSSAGPTRQSRHDTPVASDGDSTSDSGSGADSRSDSAGDSGDTPTLAPWLSVDGNALIDADGNVALQLLNPTLIASSGAGWVRLNFTLGPWSSPEDETPHGSLGLGWTETYRTIVDNLSGQGLQVYGLIGGESVQSAEPVGSDAWLTAYVYNFVAIVDRYKDTVRV